MWPIKEKITLTLVKMIGETLLRTIVIVAKTFVKGKRDWTQL